MNLLHAIPFPNIDPVLFSFEIMGRLFEIHWYAISYVVSFIFAVWWINRLIRNTNLWKDGTPPIAKLQIDDLLTWMIIGTILGGRIGFVLFYNLEFYIANPAQIIRVWEGGLSFHGGFLGVIVAGLLFCKKHKLDPWSVGDTLAFSATFGIFLVRIANFINAELWGRPTDMPWGVVFPGQAAQDCPIFWLSETCARHPSQLYESFLEGALLFAVIAYLVFKRHWLKVPGQIIGVFFIGYGFARTIVEGFRQGDAQFTGPTNPWGHVIRFGNDFDSLGLSMGQILSLPMILIGIGLLIYARKRT